MSIKISKCVLCKHFIREEYLGKAECRTFCKAFHNGERTPKTIYGQSYCAKGVGFEPIEGFADTFSTINEKDVIWEKPNNKS